jgi:hypothetical protein
MGEESEDMHIIYERDVQDSRRLLTAGLGSPREDRDYARSLSAELGLKIVDDDPFLGIQSVVPTDRVWAVLERVRADGREIESIPWYAGYLPANEGRGIDVEWLDYLLDSGFDPHWLIGHRVTWHNEERLPVVLKGDSPRLRLVLSCGRCKDDCRSVVYLRSGLHAGAWCYGDTEGGESVNLRDEEFVCEHHAR